MISLVLGRSASLLDHDRQHRPTDEDIMDMTSAHLSESSDILEDVRQNEDALTDRPFGRAASIPPGLISILVLIIAAIVAISLL
jgi:hypothetical protein